MERMEAGFRTYFTQSIAVTILFLLGSSCIRHQEKKVSKAEEGKAVLDTHIKVEHAKGFQIEYRDEKVVLQILDPRNGNLIETWELVDRNQHQGKLEDHQIPVPVQSVVCLSTTHFAYFDAVGESDKVKGAVNISYSLDSTLLNAVEQGKVEDVTSGGELHQEKALKIAPELVLVYPFGNQSYNKITTAGIPVLNITEYLEQSPLAKTEWIKLIGLLTGKEKSADNQFNNTAMAYDSLKRLAENRFKNAPCTFLNMPFKKTWNMPSGNSYAASLLSDAGYRYLYQDQKSEGNLTMEGEQVLHDAEDCKKWIIVSYLPNGISKSMLRSMIPGIQVTEAFVNDEVYVCNTAEEDYFGKATLVPDIILKDLIYWRDQSVFKNYKPQYFKRVKP